MPTDENQRRVFEFLSERLDTKEPFSKAELAKVTDWQTKSFETYWSKQFRPLVVRVDPGKYRVSESFRRYGTWNRFQTHVTQVRPVASDYLKREYGRVRIYEFFMPLTNENYLRVALDALFYRDTIKARLRTLRREDLKKYFPEQTAESELDYMSRLCDWLGKRFVGYSVYHVSGRFRAGDLVSRADAAQGYGRYLIDETTAVTRFIFPCETDDEAERIAYFFRNLFVEAIIEIVNGEDEIWMVETGMENRLHIWQMRGAEV